MRSSLCKGLFLLPPVRTVSKFPLDLGAFLWYNKMEYDYTK